MSAPDVNSVVKQLVDERQLTISQYMESLGPRLLSENDAEREEALNELVDVVLQLPNNFLTTEQVGLLLQFLMGRLESSALNGGNVIEGIKHLIVTSLNLPFNFEIPTFQTLFRDGNVQSWPQKERSKYYDILDWMLSNRIENLKPLGPDLVMSFIRAIGGERDPRCLIRVFRMFIVVANSFDLGPFAEDMFEVVACYFPVEFKPLPGEDSITRELLSSTCISCLTAHLSFAPFCSVMIDEKLEDDETTFDQKLEIFELLIVACGRFPITALLPYLETILAGIRSVALDPTHKGDVPVKCLDVLSTLMTSLAKMGAEMLNTLIVSMLENMEPFILQAEMGLCSRGLQLLRALVLASDESSAAVLDRTISWIISLVQGTTVNAAANRGDICREGLLYLGDWVELAAETQKAAVLETYESTIFLSIDEARQTTAPESLISLYRCLKAYLTANVVSEAISIRCDDILARTLSSVESDNERRYLFDFLTVSAAKRSEAHFSSLDKMFEHPTSRLASVICCSVTEERSCDYFTNHLQEFFIGEKCNFNWESFVEMLHRLGSNSSKQNLIDKMVEHVITIVMQNTSKLPDGISIHIQSMGLLISAQKHSELVSNYLECRDNGVLRLLFVQAEDTNTLLNAVTTQENATLRRLLTGAVINRTGCTDKLDNGIELEEWFSLVSAKALLLAGKPKSIEIVQQILTNFKAEHASLLDFDSAEWNPDRCKYKTTALWRQRILCQVLPLYISSVASASSKVALLSLLPSILSLADRIGPTSQTMIAQLLPVFIATFNCGESYECLLPALPSFLSTINKEQLDRKAVTTITGGLSSFVQDSKSDLNNVLYCLNSLESLARNAEPSTTQPLIGDVEKATTFCLGHKKRIIRQKAATVKNTWETLVTK